MATSRKTEATAPETSEQPEPNTAGPAPALRAAAPSASSDAEAPAPSNAEAQVPAQATNPKSPEAEAELVPGGVPVTFHGTSARAVGDLGLWEPDETKRVPKPLADRLCQPGQELFTRSAE